MFDRLEKMARRPEPFEVMTTAQLWTDDHVSGKMLEYHLDESVDVSSRNLEFVESSARWLISRFGLGPGRSVCDLGCGPGLYTTRLARTGARVTGVDFSRRSLDHARKTALGEGLKIEYVHQDYLEFRTERRFDLITLIFCDYCALSPVQRRGLAAGMRELLRPGGAVVLDYFTPEFYKAAPETAAYEHLPSGGFWSAGPHHVFRYSHKYGAEKLTLDKFVIVEPERTREIYNWLQCFTPGAIGEEFRAAGFGSVEHLADVAGGRPKPNPTEAALAAWR